MIVYIAGAINSDPDYKQKFDDAEERLLDAGYDVVNPTDIGIVEGWTWEDYMRYAISRLVECDAIYLIPGWDKSRGAAIEYKLAQELKITRIKLQGDE